jgi:hypothetical protein
MADLPLYPVAAVVELLTKGRHTNQVEQAHVQYTSIACMLESRCSPAFTYIHRPNMGIWKTPGNKQLKRQGATAYILFILTYLPHLQQTILTTLGEGRLPATHPKGLLPNTAIFQANIPHPRT